MNLPTPPRTIHKDKENQPPHPLTPSSSPRSRPLRIAWSQENLQHVYSENLRELPASSCVKAPRKSILKKVSMSHLITPERPTREVTPEPENPLHHPLYLNSPISTIVASLKPGMDGKITLTDLTEAYSVLSARLKAKTPAMIDSYGPIPALQPLKEYSEELVQAFSRDIGRAFTDPQFEPSVHPSSDSPWSSPDSIDSIKKRGFTEQEVKRARDLCNLCHAALRCFANIAVVPVTYSNFTDEQLGDILTAILAIPLATTLPTPNARKTWQLAVWTLQVQLLPTAVLTPAADRIAYAIRRGIDGELGRQGKNGGASDGLKAIVTLLLNQSNIFLAPLSEILPSVFANLTNANLSLRVEAAQALLAIAFTFAQCPCPPVSLRASLAHYTAAYLEAQNQTRKTPQDLSSISKAFKQCFDTKAVPHAATSPIWALSVIAAVIVMSGAHALTQSRTLKFTLGHLQSAMSHKRATIRAASGLVWRSLVWACVQLDKSEEESHTDQNKDSGWKVVRQLVDGAIGISIVGALIGPKEIRKKRLSHALQVVSLMIKKGGKTCEEAVDVLEQLLSRVGGTITDMSDDAWEEHSLLAESLFDGTLLRAESKNLVDYVRSCVDKTMIIRQIIPLKEDEVVQHWDVLFAIWRQAVEKAPLEQDGDIPAPVLNAWRSLLITQYQLAQGCEEHTVEPAFMSQLVELLKSYLADPGLEWVLDSSAQSWSSQVLKLGFVRNLWHAVRSIFATPALFQTAGSLLEEVIKHEYALDEAQVCHAWEMLCAELLLAGSPELMRQLWETDHSPHMKRGLWRTVVRQWLAHGGGYNGSIELLQVPFFGFIGVAFEREDLELWVQLANGALIAASVRKISAATVLDAIVSQINSVQNPVALFAVLPSLLSGIQPDGSPDARLPTVLLLLTNDALTANYPPGNSIPKPMLFDVLDSLTDTVANVGRHLILEFLKAVQGGMKLMLENQSDAFTQDEYNEHVITFYIAALESLKPVPTLFDNLHALTPLLASVFIHIPPPALGPSAFKSFWTTTYRSLGSSDLQYPEALKPILRNIQEVMCDSDEEYAPGISQATQTQNADVIVSHNAVKISHDLGDSKTRSAIIHTVDQFLDAPNEVISSPPVLAAQADSGSIDANAELNADTQHFPSPVTPDLLLAGCIIPHPLKVEFDAENTSTDGINESGAQPRLNVDLGPNSPKPCGQSPVMSPTTNRFSNSLLVAKVHIGKENSDVDAIITVADSQVRNASQLRRSGSILGKRKKSRSSFSSKRRRSNPAPGIEIINVSDDENDEAAVEDSIVVTRIKSKRAHPVDEPDQSQETSTPKSTSRPTSPRLVHGQKQTEFDAIEIPKMDSKQPAQHGNTSGKLSSEQIQELNKLLSKKRRESYLGDDIAETSPTASKRRRVKDMPLKHEAFEPWPATSQNTYNSNDDLGLPQTPQRSSDISLPSSRAGRISARRISSPVPKRARSEIYDPPSDDSMSSSPSKRVAARRQLTRAKTVPASSALCPRASRRKSSDEYLALQQAYIAITKGASNMTIQELFDASRMANSINMVLNDQMAKKFSSPHTVTESP